MPTLFALVAVIGISSEIFSIAGRSIAIVAECLYLTGIGVCATIPCWGQRSDLASLSGDPGRDLLIAVAWPVSWVYLLIRFMRRGVIAAVR